MVYLEATAVTLPYVKGIGDSLSLSMVSEARDSSILTYLEKAQRNLSWNFSLSILTKQMPTPRSLNLIDFDQQDPFQNGLETSLKLFQKRATPFLALLRISELTRWTTG
jgi:hypothetical protein